MSTTANWLSRGLWSENPVLVHLLGLCPLLAVTNTVVNALLLGLATLLVLIATNLVVSSLRHAFVSSVRIPLFVLIIASFVTSVDLLIDAWFHDLHLLIGLFIPLIVTNCTILAQAETVASRHRISIALRSAIGTGAGFLAVLLALGAIREAFGQGTLFSGFELLVGQSGELLEINLPFDGALAFVLAPGAFLGLAVLLALRNRIVETRRERRKTSSDLHAA
jgi:electron transport complex protein RnfE